MSNAVPLYLLADRLCTPGALPSLITLALCFRHRLELAPGQALCERLPVVPDVGAMAVAVHVAHGAVVVLLACAHLSRSMLR